MVVEKGYKQTEVGVIPYDWDLKMLGELVKVIGGGTPSTNNKSFWNGSINWFTPTEIGYNKYVSSSNRKISELGYDNCSATLLPEGTILLTSRAGIGDAAILLSEATTNQGFQSLLAGEKIYNEFLYYLILSKKGDLLRLASGSTFLEISPSKVKSIIVPCPPLPEQTAIANALSDMDALIAQTEKLIEKKKAIKQGVMQELLKPKEGWVTKKLGEVCIAMKGKILGKSDVNPNGKYDCILYGELFTTYKEEIFDIKSRTNQTGVASVCDDILFPGSTTTSGIDLAKCSVVLKDNVQLGGDIVILRKQTKEINSLFVAYYLNQFCKNEIAQSTRGITIHHLYGKDLVGIKIKYPELTEQLRIVNSILDIEYEVEILIKKLQKLKHQKQGMMQALLTGKIRLI
jgi:type I restriction enzyme S subunit